MEELSQAELLKAAGLEDYKSADVLKDISGLPDEDYLAFAYQTIVWSNWKEDPEAREVAAGMVAELKRRNMADPDAQKYIYCFENNLSEDAANAYINK